MQCRSIRRSGQPTWAMASRMRAFDRDLIRGGHYGQRSRVPREKGRTHGCSDQPCCVKILLANPEPSTHGPMLPISKCVQVSAVGWKPEAPGGGPDRRFLTQSRHFNQRNPRQDASPGRSSLAGEPGAPPWMSEVGCGSLALNIRRGIARARGKRAGPSKPHAVD